MSDKTCLLIVDDDEEIRTLLADFLQPYGFEILLANDGVEMFAHLEKTDAKVKLIILDVMMPGDDGITLCTKLRAQSNLPIIMLTAIGDETDRIIGLEVGADDYVAKPFNPRELLARIKAVLRRFQETGEQSRPRSLMQPATGAVYSFAKWRLNMNTRMLLSPDNLEVSVSAGEYDLLVTLIKHPHRVLSRDQLLDMTKNVSASKCRVAPSFPL